jgi:outer membrane murein-binding lipoprotein Lpp
MNISELEKKYQSLSADVSKLSKKQKSLSNKMEKEHKALESNRSPQSKAMKKNGMFKTEDVSRRSNGNFKNTTPGKIEDTDASPHSLKKTVKNMKRFSPSPCKFHNNSTRANEC